MVLGGDGVLVLGEGEVITAEELARRIDALHCD
jgi:hypothetical protein